MIRTVLAIMVKFELTLSFRHSLGWKSGRQSRPVMTLLMEAQKFTVERALTTCLPELT